MSEINVSLSEQELVRRAKLQKLCEEGKDPFVKTLFDVSAHSDEIKNNYDELEGKEVAIAGRLMSRRIMGKASFTHIADRNGEIQVYVKRDDIGEEDYASFKKDYDIGDIVGVRGIVFKTNSGEVSVHATHFEMLAKSLRPLPEKFKGLKDIDAKYRHREVDLIMNENVRETFIMRSKIINFLRAFLNECVEELNEYRALGGDLGKLNVLLLSDSDSLFIGLDLRKINARILLDSLYHSKTLPMSEVDLLALIRDLGRAANSNDELLHHFLNKIHHTNEIGISLIKLDAGKLGVVLGVHTLVTEDTADLVDLLKAAYDKSL